MKHCDGRYKNDMFLDWHNYYIVERNPNANFIPVSIIIMMF